MDNRRPSVENSDIPVCKDCETVPVPRVRLAKLQADSEAYAKLRAEIAGAPVVEMPSRPGPKFHGPHLTITTNAAERMGLAGQRVALLRLPAGEGE